ncbi:MAG: putative tRNA threonylcarbamoyladenosine biosynthesis protein Gcp [Candidatus Jorgensenbacteria bacterium GW2011_GWA2_45_13]|uniref:tRNA N6-adenosine threonylcarbamoyltransferase n=1 Tax=Candidatus Jorgensenbacteria bacterium GW2011_GWA2_45_13 TaxID=1618662 RepID=A0A0G1L980_9BACT|nr:MAG: putative tRNA threonylcarbamoyladenosine biosynthesis protein Gcp [Candidatus Jorgensenbacteria bacterium GW2011_GWA2_45_13]
MKILAIETSCDETALALLEAGGGIRSPKFEILGSAIASQIPIHRPFGGVVPNLAKREHIKNLPIVLEQILGSPTSLRKSDFLRIDAICVTVGPGLEPALWTGIEFAKKLYKEFKIKNKKLELIGTNHLEGHLYSFLLAQKTEFPISNFSARVGSSFGGQFSKKSKQKSQLPITKLFPAIALIVSGGHTILLRMDSLTKWKKLGETRDDAVGESFDKVAKMLGLPYPGGPEIQKLAKKGNPHAIEFPRPMIHDKNYDFSYSGLKTSVLYYLRDNIDPHKSISNPYESAFAADVAASFQEAALDVLVKKTERAVKEFGAKSILLSGGVAANSRLRELLKTSTQGGSASGEKNYKLKTVFIAPPMDFNTDNAVMIGVAGYMSMLRKKNRRITAQGNMGIFIQ